MAESVVTIPDAVLEVLKEGTWRAGGFSMPEVTRPTYLATAKVLTALGGKWNSRVQLTVFENEDAEEAIYEACRTGTYRDLKKLYQAFWTPREIVVKMIEAAGGVFDDEGECPFMHAKTLLEPSAGHGNIATLVQVLGADVQAVEIQERLVSELQKDGFRVVCGDFLRMDAHVKYDLVLMNPPFMRSQDITHVRHAHNFIGPGGTLVAIMSPGFTFRSDNKAENFRNWLSKVGGEYTNLPEGSFRSAGTNVNTVMVVIKKE